MRRVAWFFALVLLLSGCGSTAPTPVPTAGLPTQSALASHPPGTTYYVRPDGGSAEQCSGVVDAPYPGTGTNQPCAWDHPFRALVPPHEYARLQGGDTLIIDRGSYQTARRPTRYRGV